MPRKRTGTKKRIIPLVYRRGEVTVRHVDMASDLLDHEVERLANVAARTLRFLDVPLRKHPLVRHVVFKLKAIARTATIADTDERKVLEIGRLNLVLNESLAVLDRMPTPYELLEKARFTIRYGQTSKKRETGWNSFPRDRDRERDHVADPEGDHHVDD